jgi:hypothetical protein
MGKGYYIVGAVLLGVGAYFLYNKIKKGNASFNFRNEYVSESEAGSHLEPPMEATSNTPPFVTPPFVTPPFVPTV